MKHRFIALLASAAAWVALAGPASALTSGGAHPTLATGANLPFSFQAVGGDPNRAPDGFLTRGRHYELWITATEARLNLSKAGVAAPLGPGDRLAETSRQSPAFRTVTMRLLEANPQARLAGEQPIPGKINYLVGTDPQQWRTSIPCYAKVHAGRVYPGIDVVYYGNGRQLEYDFTVAPGANVSDIALRFEGADAVTINPRGELVLTVGGDELLQHRPEIYQVVDGKRREVRGGYVPRDERTVGFAVGSYDRDRPLIIDPILTYSTYFGGNAGDIGFAVKVDGRGFVYLAGQTLSSQFPFAIPAGAFEPVYQGGKFNGDAFVAKLDNTGSNLVYFTYLGGRGNDGVFSLAVDEEGHAFVTGFTDSPDFPVAPAGVGVPGLSTSIGGKEDSQFDAYPLDAFVTELSPDGSSLVYSTYLGGSGADVAGSIALDPSRNVYVTGNTTSTNFPVLSPLAFQLAGSTNLFLNQMAGSNDVFVTKIAAGGSGLIYSTYLGGYNSDEGGGIAADADGFAYVTGYTASTNFPITAGAFQQYINGFTNAASKYYRKLVPFDAFIARIAPAGGALVYSTYFGGGASDSGFRIGLDAFRNTYVCGSVQSVDFPSTATNIIRAGLTNENRPNSDVFLAKFDPAGALSFSAMFGSTRNDAAWDLAVEPASGAAFVVGISGFTNFPVHNSAGFNTPTNRSAKYTDVFVTAFNPDATLIYSLLLGGAQDDVAYGIGVDPARNAYVVGRTLSTNFPAAGFPSSMHGTNDAFLAKISLEPTLLAAPAGNSIQVQWQAFSPEFELDAGVISGSTATWSPAPHAPTLAGGRHTVVIGPTNSATIFRLRRK